MSTAVEKRTLQEAISEARGFRDLFDGCYQRWVVAGSVRRQRPLVGDVEHVVIPKWADVPGDDLFATPTRTNLLLSRCDKLCSAGMMAKHVYGYGKSGEPAYRWGSFNRGCEFRSFNHEIFSADPVNWGSKLAICTGPAEFSTMLVTALHKQMLRNQTGCVWRCSRCKCTNSAPRGIQGCVYCDGTGLKPTVVVPTPTEESFFDLAGVGWIEPCRR